MPYFNFPARPMPIKELASPLTKEMAELFLIYADLDHAHMILLLWADKYRPGKPMSQISMRISTSLFRDSIVQFVACFDKNSSPHALRPEDIYIATEEHVYFEHLKDLRDAYAAHRFGPHRQCVVGIAHNGTRLGLGYELTIFAGWPEDASTQKLVAFVEKARQYVRNRISDLKKIILDDLSHVSREELLTWKDLESPRFVEEAQVRMSREAFQEGRSGKRKTKRGSI